MTTFPEGKVYSTSEEISADEYEVIKKFLASYRDQSVIVADNFRQDFGMVPLEDERFIFKTNEDTWKSINFRRMIYHKNKPYVVELGLWRVGHMEDDPKCLCVHEFRITTPERVHFIDLNIQDVIKGKILFNILSIFDEGKIISPEQAYCKYMYMDRNLQKFITNHEWVRIAEGLKQKPSLENALFIISEEYASYLNYTADFGTVLYQLISFRKNHQKDFDDRDLLELDKLICQLHKTQLLKVQLHEKLGGSKSYPTGSILLESINYSSRVHISEQYNVGNGELAEEESVLKECVRTLKK